MNILKNEWVSDYKYNLEVEVDEINEKFSILSFIEDLHKRFKLSNGIYDVTIFDYKNNKNYNLKYSYLGGNIVVIEENIYEYK